MRMLAPAQNTAVLARLGARSTFHLGMLEAQPLQRVGELDIDAEIVGIELELVALEQAAVLVDVHGQLGDVAVEAQLPMPIARGSVWKSMRARFVLRACDCLSAMGAVLAVRPLERGRQSGLL